MNPKKSFNSKILLISLVAFLIIFGGSHAFGYEWSKTFGGSNNDEGRSVQQTSDGGYIIAAQNQPYIIKTDPYGNKQWDKQINFRVGHAVPSINSVQQTTDGGYAVFGTGADGTHECVQLIKTDADGNELWSTCWFACSHFFSSSFQQTTDEGYIIAGWSYCGPIHLIKTDSVGNELWMKTVGNAADRGSSVQQTSDGGYIIAGVTWVEDLQSGGSKTDVCLIKTDALGNELWRKTFGDSEVDYGNSVQQTADGGFIITGYTNSFGAGGTDVYLIKTDGDGNELWSKTFGGEDDDDEGRSVQQTSDGGFIIAGLKVDLDAGDGPTSIAVGDLNGDGVPDLAVANWYSDNVSVLFCNGDGTFETAENYGAGDKPKSVAIGDLNGDDNLDLAVANAHSANVSVLLGNGDGTFKAAENYGAGDDPNSVAIGDLNGDDNLDLAVANAHSANVSVLLGNGDGTFKAAENYGAGDDPNSVAIGDLNGDGNSDLAVANRYGANVSVLLGNGNGSFQSAVNYSAGDGPISVAIGDLNGDAKLDLAVANRWSDNVSVLLGNGDGSFQSAVNYGAGDHPISIAVGDLNGDDNLDLAVANGGSDNVSVLLGNGDGTFKAAENYDAGDGPSSIAVGDLNGDDKLDLAVANGGSDNVSVLLGNGDGTFQAAVGYGGGDVYLIKTDSNGNELWTKTFGGSADEQGNSVQQTTDGGYIIAGSTRSYGAGGNDVYLIYYNPIPTVNDLVTFEPDPSTYKFTPDTSNCPTGFVGKFSFDATLANNSVKVLSNMSVLIDELTNGNLCLTNVGLIGENQLFDVPKIDDYADGYLSADEYVDVPFTVCLKNKKLFRFFVNVVGVTEN